MSTMFRPARVIALLSHQLARWLEVHCGRSRWDLLKPPWMPNKSAIGSWPEHHIERHRSGLAASDNHIDDTKYQRGLRARHLLPRP